MSCCQQAPNMCQQVNINDYEDVVVTSLSSTPAVQQVNNFHIITSNEQYTEKIQQNNYVVVDFYAKWCGPCKNIAPHYEQLAQEKPNITFLKVDVDEDGVSSFVEELSVSALPTFIFYKNGEIHSRFAGASLEKIKNTIEQMCA